METIRQQKIAKLIQKEISDIIFKEVKHLCGKSMVTVTIVRITTDLSICKVFLSVFGSDKKEEIVENFNRSKTEIRFLLGKELRNQVRQIPELQFYQDDTLDYLEKIDKALKG